MCRIDHQFLSNMKLRHLVLMLGFTYLNHPVLAKPGVTDQVRPVRTELYFGWVPSVEWKEFLAKEVTPLFPDGLTWFDVAGQWKAPAGEIEKGHSRLLIILYPDTQQNDRAIEMIRQRFKVRFHQQAVLRVSVKVEAKDLSALDPSTEFRGSVAKMPTPNPQAKVSAPTLHARSEVEVSLTPSLAIAVGALSLGGRGLPRLVQKLV
jgi:uncharacterized protein DUF3574